VVHPLLLMWLVPRLGFDGSAMAIAGTQLVQVVLAIGITVGMERAFVQGTWPRWEWGLMKEVLDQIELWNYVSLSLGGDTFIE